jgi:hypothetical protein
MTGSPEEEPKDLNRILVSGPISNAPAGPKPAESNRREPFQFKPLKPESEIVSIQGSEVIIYEEPREIPELSNFHMMMYVFIQIGSELLFKIVFALCIILAFNQRKLSIVPLLLALVLFQVWKILFNAYYVLRYASRSAAFAWVYYLDIMLSTGYLVVFLGLFLAFRHQMDPTYLPLIVVPHIILTLTRLCIGESLNTPFLPGSVFCFLESFQFLYIALKLASPESYANWTWVLLFYYVVVIGYFIAAIAIMVALLIVLLSILFNSPMYRDYEGLAKFLVVCVMFYFVWNGIAYYYIVSGFDTLLEKKLIGIRTVTGTPDPRLLFAVYFVMVCAILTLILLVIAYFLLKEVLLKFFNKGKPKEISLLSFARNMDLHVDKVTGYYMKKKSKNQDAATMHRSSEPTSLEPCMICCNNKSDVMFHPCRHNGMCQDCLRQYLREKDTCPVCRDKIEVAYLVIYDTTKKTYLAKGMIKIKR